MNMQSDKSRLLKVLQETEDWNLIKEVWTLVRAHTGKTYRSDEWHDEVKSDVEEAIEQAEDGQLIPHKEAITKLKKWH